MIRNRNKLSPLAVACISGLCACGASAPSEQPLVGREVLYFDAGPAGSILELRAVELNVESTYTPSLGFGWLQRPKDSLHRSELRRSRTPFTIDGVSGDRLKFRADVDPGTWYLTIWLETRNAEGQWPQFIVQDNEELLRWQRFEPQEEPSRSPQKVYRVFHGATSVDKKGLLVELIGPESSVRLLGLSLIRHTSRKKPEHLAFLKQVEAAGHYPSRDSLNNLLRDAQSSLRVNPTDAFWAIWCQRIDLLATAERYYEMRGWQWADEKTGLGMFDRQYQAVALLDSLLMLDSAEAQPLTERALFLRGRLLYWLGQQRGEVEAIAGSRRDLQCLAGKYPDDQLLAMYLGRRVDTTDECERLEPTTAAPPWSNAQREALGRLRQLVHWWVEERQSDSGELGGKFGDDVEILRWWAPLCLVGDELALRGWKRMADGVWQSEHIVDGYARKLADVEHAAEFVADTTPLMLLYNDDPQYKQRLALSAKHFESLWTGTTTNGNRFFRSAWFNSTGVQTDEPKGRDVEYNTRAAQALRYLAWRNSHPRIVELLHEWSTAWVTVAMRTDKGKPRGIIPASVRFSDESINGEGPTWYQAGMYWDYYEWEHYCGSLLLDQLLFTYSLTIDDRLLQPMFKTLKLIQSEESRLTENKRSPPPEGSAAWVAAKLIECKQFWCVVEQWRIMFGDKRWDDLIMRHGTPYGRYRISGDERHLVAGLNVLLDEVRYNTPLRTTEAVYTDRVRVPGAELLKAMLTGDSVKDNLSPYYSVTWQQTDRDFTALLTDADPEYLHVELFNHGLKDRDVLMRVWQLTPGKYELVCESQGVKRHLVPVTIDRRGQRIPVNVPSQRLLRVTVHPEH